MHENKHADQQCGVDQWQIDLSRLRFRGVADLESRQEAEVYRLSHERERAGDHGLAGDDRRGSGQNHDRQQSPARKHEEKWIGNGFGMRQH